MYFPKSQQQKVFFSAAKDFLKISNDIVVCFALF